MNKKIRAIGALLVVLVWAALTGFAWFSPDKTFSETERASLDQFPELSLDTILAERRPFMEKFNEYTLDQFPLRDRFRELKALFHLKVMQNLDNNGKYEAQGYITDMAALNDKVLEGNIASLSYLYDNYLKNTAGNVAITVVPDKHYYMAQETGHLAMDYDTLFQTVKDFAGDKMTYVDLTGLLERDDFYRTDTHWKQESIVDVASAIAQALSVEGPKNEDFEKVKLNNTFYGVYFGQLALPLEGEDMYILTNDILKGCTVKYLGGMEENIQQGPYDMEKTDHYDMYEVFLSGTQALIEIENPNARTDKELVVIRDSFGSALTPLLLQDYAKVTVVDIRWLSSWRPNLQNFVTFSNQDVLVEYSAIVLNTVNLK